MGRNQIFSTAKQQQGQITAKRAALSAQLVKDD